MQLLPQFPRPRLSKGGFLRARELGAAGLAVASVRTTPGMVAAAAVDAATTFLDAALSPAAASCFLPAAAAAPAAASAAIAAAARKGIVQGYRADVCWVNEESSTGTSKSVKQIAVHSRMRCNDVPPSNILRRSIRVLQVKRWGVQCVDMHTGTPNFVVDT